MLDISGSEARDPLDDFDKITRELEAYGDLKDRPMIVAANKTDLPGAEENLARLKEKLAGTGLQIFPISAATRSNLNPLVYAIADMHATLPPIEPFDEEDMYDIETDKGEMYAISVDNGVYVVEGRAMDYLINSVNFSSEESLNYFHRTLRRWGVIDALREKGAHEGDLVSIGGMEFDFVD